jgi:hypothetical protein
VLIITPVPTGCQLLFLAQVEGFEPPSTVLETAVLPLHHTHTLVVPARIELATFRLSGERSNQLSYGTVKITTLKKV